MKSPASLLPRAHEAIQALNAASEHSGLPVATRILVHLRTSQLNGCSSCVDAARQHGKQEGQSEERLFAVAAWRDTPYFTDAERAALALAEAVTCLSDRPEPVTDEIWDEAARHYKEPALAALILWIATSNLFNRLNVPTRQVAGTWG